MVGDREETIVARCTPRGESGVALVRLSGAGALRIGAGVFRCRPELGSRHRVVEYGAVAVGGREIDTGLAWTMRAPCSYTGEDTVEISCHGSMLVVDALVAEAVRLGARLAEPGEFTRRAFLHGKLDLAQAEGVVELVHAGSEFGVANAYGLASGRLSGWTKAVREEVVDVLARLEVGLDFGEEDVAPARRGELRSRLEAVSDDARALADSFEGTRRRSDGYLVALVGRPNVGKSTLLNALSGDERAIVSSEAGTTRDLIEVRVVMAGEVLRLVDTAGIRMEEGEAERLGVGRALDVESRADVSVLVVDGGCRWGAEDESVVKRLRRGPDVVALNKSDLGRECELPSRLADSGSIVPVSGLTGDGVEELRGRIGRSLPGRGEGELRGLRRERHRVCVGAVADAVGRAAAGLKSGVGEECCAADLWEALGGLDELVGVGASEAVLDRIFGEFCIGK
jgi:tRNA modification GTPase